MDHDDARQRALLRSFQAVQRNSLHQSSSREDAYLDDDQYFAVSYAMQVLGDRRNIVNNKVGFRELLDLNNISYREVKVPANLLNLSRSVLICFSMNDGLPMVIHSNGFRTCCVNKIKSVTLTQNQNYQLKPYAYEIYPGFPSPLSSIFELLRFSFLGHVAPLVFILIGSISLSFISLAVPLLTAFIIGTVVPMSDFRLIVETSLLVLLILLFTIASDAFSDLAVIRLDSILNLRLEASLWNHMLRLPLSFFRRIDTADLVDRVGSISDMREILSDGLIDSTLSLLFSTPSLALMFVFMPKLAGIAAVYTLLSASLIAVLVYRAASFERSYREDEASLTSMSLQTVVGMPQIRASGSEPFVFERWIQRVIKLARTMTRVDRATDNIQILASVLVPLGQLIVFIGFYSLVDTTGSRDMTSSGEIGSIFSSPNNQAVAAFLAFQAAYLSFTSKISSFASTAASTLSRLVVLWQRSLVVIKALPEKGQRSDGRLHDLRGNFELINLRARYPDQDQFVLHDINLEIPIGSYTAITGPSGSGKTTLLRCLLQLVDVDSGLIKVDGISLNDLDIRHYRRQIGVVLQNDQLPTGTIYEIILAGRTHTREQIWDALEKACVADDVHRMPMQLETDITEGAMAISVGQRQRIALARALLSEPKALFLDEATSALDANLQARVIDTLDHLKITRVAIAHRLSTIASADQVIYIQNGEIKMFGSYQDVYNICKHN